MADRSTQHGTASRAPGRAPDGPVASGPPAAAPGRPGATRRRPGAALGPAARLLAVRLRFAVLGAVAPRRAGYEAFRMWLQVPDTAGRRKDLRPRPGTIGRLTTARGATVVTESWGEGRAVLLVHGWGGWRGQLGAFVDPLLAAGYRVVALDAPGHGEAGPASTGPGTSSLLEMAEAVETVGRATGHLAGVVAHSLGCTAAALAVRDGVRADRLVLVAPNHDFGVIAQRFGALVRLSDRTLAAMRAQVAAFADRPLDRFDLAPLGADGGQPPTLVIHDRDDKETPSAVGEAVAAAWPTATLLLTSGLGHQRILADAVTIARAVEHVVGPRTTGDASA